MASGRDQDIQLLRDIVAQLRTLNTNLSVANAKYPTVYDFVEVTSVNGAGDPLVIEHSLDGVLQFTHTITYDGSGNFESLTIS
jgi:hypothetical protein